jgi:hypothetical protein
MSQERVKILEMLQEGKISAAEAEALLSSVETTTSVAPRKAGGPFKMFRVKVLSAEGDKVNVQIPLSLVRVGLQIGKGISKSGNFSNGKSIDFDAMGIDIEKIIELAEEGAIGKLVDVESANGDYVEVYVE